jgi:hypothetical protein
MLEGDSFAWLEVGCQEWKGKAWLKGPGIDSESIQRLEEMPSRERLRGSKQEISRSNVL